MTPHKHAEVIKAWADGAQIQMFIYTGALVCTGEWVDTYNPRWDVNQEYRVKPEPKPDVVRFMVYAGDFGFIKTFDEAARIAKGCDRSWVVKVVIDGETGAGKLAEVVS